MKNPLSIFLSCTLPVLSLLSWSAPLRASAIELESLPRLKIDRSRVMVTGLSSGGFMAAQLGVALSSTFSGVAVFAGGAYGCASGSLAGAGLCLTLPEQVDVSALVSQAQLRAATGLIDPLAGLKNQRLFLFSGRNDRTTPPGTVNLLREFYERTASARNLLVEDTVMAGHGQPTLAHGGDCDKTRSPWILNCGYDGAGVALRHLLGPLKPAVPAMAAHWLHFRQSSHADASALLGETGSVYVPKGCANSRARCALLVALHGCRQSPDLLGPEYREHSGFNEWAEANEIVVLYPTTRASLLNPKACWDWWGYTGPEYADRRGPQIRAVKAMIDALSD